MDERGKTRLTHATTQGVHWPLHWPVSHGLWCSRWLLNCKDGPLYTDDCSGCWRHRTSFVHLTRLIKSNIGHGIKNTEEAKSLTTRDILSSAHWWDSADAGFCYTNVFLLISQNRKWDFKPKCVYIIVLIVYFKIQFDTGLSNKTTIDSVISISIFAAVVEIEPATLMAQMLLCPTWLEK